MLQRQLQAATGSVTEEAKLLMAFSESVRLQCACLTHYKVLAAKCNLKYLSLWSVFEWLCYVLRFM